MLLRWFKFETPQFTIVNQNYPNFVLSKVFDKPLYSFAVDFFIG
ncbi:hypothetical protein JBKA6_1419 [Ichthyobacterium seriolicida]|uniref:Uncharacterized protein n=1 Tax=Ichthyobacterium seriolicida TaxID=242600 RepID=A0A1J1ED34_9FLAO|nr:hypothetical protein JBKA6_1419 [Ichthyobacterium seriolicida]